MTHRRNHRFLLPFDPFKDPTKPFFGFNKPFMIVFFLYLATLALTIFQAYGLRLQRTIAAHFYAEREVSRAENQLC